MDHDTKMKSADMLAQIMTAERASKDHEKKAAMLEEFANEAMKTRVADPDRICMLIEHMLLPSDPRFPGRGELRGICPAFIQILEDGPGIEAGATRVRDLMIAAIRAGEDLDIYQAVAICEELAARLVYRSGPLTVTDDFLGKR